MTEHIGCVVIGAGVIGLAVGRALALADRDVIILESKNSIGTETSARNSEVIHAGIYYPEGSLKTRLCVLGRHQMYAFCADHGVTAKKTTKLVFAIDEAEKKSLTELQSKARRNGVLLQWLDEDQVHRLEPNLRCAAALLSPETGVVDSHGFMLALQGDAEAHGAVIAFNSPVTGGSLESNGLVLNIGGTEAMTLSCNTVINCAGLGAQQVSRSITGVNAETIPPLNNAKGSYFYLSGKAPFSRLIYPIPSTATLGLHYTLDLSGQARFGPDLEWTDAISYTVDPGRADLFYAAIRRYWPGLPDGALRPGYAGIRPKVQAEGEAAHDFVIQGPEETGLLGYCALYGIESPGLTSSLAIADYVAEIAL
jgi:L-2-hydroxyglutarate oxidase LhgO